VDLEIRAPTYDVRELRASECQGFSLKWNRGGELPAFGRWVLCPPYVFDAAQTCRARPGTGGAELWVWRSAIAGMGDGAVSSAVRSVSGASRGTTGRCRGVMFTDVEHGHAGARRLDLSTANGTGGDSRSRCLCLVRPRK